MAARILTLIVLSSLACNGSIGDVDLPSELPPPAHDRDLTGPPGADDLRRLTRPEYLATITDLFGDDVVDALTVALAGHPTDSIEGAYPTMAQEITAPLVTNHLSIADALAQVLLEDEVSRTAIAPCLADLSDEGCIVDVISTFGRRVLRRTPNVEESGELLEAYRDGAEITPEDGFQNFIVTLFMSPAFIYRLELDGEESEAPGTYWLSDVELATRLSYAVWGTTPDAELLDAAESGELSTPAGYEQAVDRLFEDPKARTQAENFFGDWLQYRNVPEIQQPDSFLDGVEREGLAEAMRADLDWMLINHVFDQRSGYPELHTTTLANPTAGLTEVYGSSIGPVELDAETRAGVLTRAGMLVGSERETNLVHRGAFTLKRVLCEEIGLPVDENGDDVPFEPPAFDPNLTARERWTNQTGGGECATCHSRINPVGFAFEGYDTLGRVRTTELIFSEDTGELINELPVDVEASFRVDGEDVVAMGAVEFGEAIADSPQSHRCFAEHWFRYVRGRLPTGNGDRRLLAEQTDRSRDGGTLLGVFRQLVTSDEFKQRTIGMENDE